MFFYLFIFLLGLVVGSFLNVIILRLHSGEKVNTKRSHCPHCRHDLSPRELIPLLSFFLQRGRCHHCQAKISWQYPLVELSAGLLFVLAAYQLVGGVDAQLLFVSRAIFWLWLRQLIFISLLIVIFVFDFRWYIIPDKVTLPAMAVVFVINFFAGWPWANLLVAGVVGLGFFALQFAVSRGKWIGGGDLRLGALLGLMLGWPQIIVALFFAYIIGAVFSLGLIATGHKKLGTGATLPFGTFLVCGALVALFWGEALVTWYFGLV